MADAKGEEVVLTVTDVSCVPEVGCYTYFELMFTHKLVRTPPATFRRGILCSKPPNSGILKSVGPRGPLAVRIPYSLCNRQGKSNLQYTILIFGTNQSTVSDWWVWNKALKCTGFQIVISFSDRVLYPGNVGGGEVPWYPMFVQAQKHDFMR